MTGFQDQLGVDISNSGFQSGVLLSSEGFKTGSRISVWVWVSSKMCFPCCAFSRRQYESGCVLRPLDARTPSSPQTCSLIFGRDSIVSADATA